MAALLWLVLKPVFELELSNSLKSSFFSNQFCMLYLLFFSRHIFFVAPVFPPRPIVSVLSTS